MFRSTFMESCLAVAVTAVLIQSVEAQSFGTAFTYQGNLKSSGELVNDQADLEFTLWTDAVDGTQVGQSILFTGVQVADGFFSVDLDFGNASWDGNARWLQVSSRVPSGAGGFSVLPRQQVMPVPFALRAAALTSGNLGLGGVSDPLYPLTFANTTGDKISLYGNSNNHYGFGVQSNQLQIFTDNAVSNLTFGYKDPQGAMVETMRVKGDGRVGIGTINPRNALHAVGNGNTLTLEGTDHTFMEFFPDGIAGGRGAYIGYSNATNNNLIIRSSLENAHLLLGVAASGNIGIGFNDNGVPLAKLHVNGTTRTTGFQLTGNGAGAGKVLSSDANGIASWVNAPAGSQWSNSGSNIHFSSGNVGVGISSPSAKLDVSGTLRVSDQVELTTGVIRKGAGTVATSDLGLYSMSSGAWMRLVSNNAPIQFFTNSANGSSGSPPNNSAAMTIAANGNIGIGTHSPAAKFDVAGVMRVDTLEIDAGADLAENFDIAPAGMGDDAVHVAPGMVVSIDRGEVGKLVVSSEAYDRRVAGIVSGGGDVRPGLTLSQPGTVADGEHPVASVGRVWCYADADAGGPIEAGDILTTSATPGHAMRASDPALAPGSTIGKAMSSLESGKGLVLVLVSLQ